MPEPREDIAACQTCGASMDVSSVPPYTNVECPACGGHTRVKTQFGPYTLVRRHALGGMSMVFAAYDTTLNREVALKILSEEYSADERRIAAFEEEARITASFSHPNVVRVLTTGRAFGRLYIAMEFVPGGHFERRIRDRGKVPEREMLTLAIEVAQGLKAAHSAGLIHRDVKPGNILLDAEGHGKLVDFGLALVTQGGKATATELWATPYYVPPETVEGLSEDFRSDIYAFGATLYHALAGKPPCGVESMSTDLLRDAKKRVVPLNLVEPSISSETCRIVDRAMAYDPENRFSSYDELLAALAGALNQSGFPSRRGIAAKRRALKKRQEQGLLVAGLLTILMVIVGIFAFQYFRKPKETLAANPAPPPVVPVGTVPENATSIMKTYVEARAALDARNFQKAANTFIGLHRNAAVQEPTRTWSGVEAVIVTYLDGRAPDARNLAREVADHVRSLPKEKSPVHKHLLDVMERLSWMKPISEPGTNEAGGGVSRLAAAMLAGLKDWEQGMPHPAAACFSVAVSCELSTDDQWAAVYQKLAADYLSDHEIIGGPLFSGYPKDKAGCEALIEDLNEAMKRLKTKGRARYNVRAWQLDLARHAKLLSMAGKGGATGKQTPELPVLMAKLDEFARDCRFPDAVSYLKSLSDDPEGASLKSLLTMAENSMVFLSDLEEDLEKEPVSLTMQMRSGETMVKISIDADGTITGFSAAAETKTCKWSDFMPASLIELHRLLVKVPRSDADRIRWHECAIAYDWLAGERQRALAAAANLSQSSDEFKERWEIIARGLPK